MASEQFKVLVDGPIDVTALGVLLVMHNGRIVSEMTKELSQRCMGRDAGCVECAVVVPGSHSESFRILASAIGLIKREVSVLKT